MINTGAAYASLFTSKLRRKEAFRVLAGARQPGAHRPVQRDATARGCGVTGLMKIRKQLRLRRNTSFRIPATSAGGPWALQPHPPRLSSARHGREASGGQGPARFSLAHREPAPAVRHVASFPEQLGRREASQQALGLCAGVRRPGRGSIASSPASGEADERCRR